MNGDILLHNSIVTLEKVVPTPDDTRQLFTNRRNLVCKTVPKTLRDTMESFANLRPRRVLLLRAFEMCGIHLNRVHSEKCCR